MEIWRKIDLDKTGKYEVSNLGRIRSLWRNNQYGHSADKIYYFVPQLNRNYYRVNLTIEGKTQGYYVARLVAKAFPEICGEWFEGCEVNHKNEITTDNRAENLELCTPSYNSSYGTRNQRIRETLDNYGKEVRQYTKKGELVHVYKDIFEVRDLNPKFQIGYLEQVLRDTKHRHSAYGFKWSGGKYYENSGSTRETL